jgi:UDP-N-acetylglucosamine transferase subunit ALG13
MIFVTVSTGHFDPLIKFCDQLFQRDPKQFPFFGQIGSGVYLPKFSYKKMMAPDELDRAMAEAEIVISHGGTGMLSRLYRLRKKTLVIPKQVRYGEANEGQVELAVKWAGLGMATLCMDVKDLESKIIECRKTEFSFPTFPRLGESLEVVLGQGFRAVGI